MHGDRQCGLPPHRPSVRLDWSGDASGGSEFGSVTRKTAGRAHYEISLTVIYIGNVVYQARVGTQGR